MPRRPPKKWFQKVVAGMKKRTGREKIDDPEAAAGWLWYHGLTAQKRREILSTENPRVSGRFMNEAIRLFERFHGRKAKRGEVITIPDPPSVVTLLGEVVQINYRATKHGDKGETEYYHRFKHPRPLLVTDGKGRRLFLSGGTYKITDAGIEG